MTALTTNEIVFINEHYQRAGDINIEGIDKKRHLCFVSMPVYEKKNPLNSAFKTITFSAEYCFDFEDEGFVIRNIPYILSSADAASIFDYIEEQYDVDSEK